MIGVGENNTFGHPNEEVLQRLKNLGAQIYRTDIDGEVEIKFTKINLSVENKPKKEYNNK